MGILSRFDHFRRYLSDHGRAPHQPRVLEHDKSLAALPVSSVLGADGVAGARDCLLYRRVCLRSIDLQRPDGIFLLIATWSQSGHLEPYYAHTYLSTPSRCSW